MNKRLKSGMRRLTEQERNLINKNLKILEEDLEYKEKVVLARKQFAVDVSELEYKKQIKDLKREIKVLGKELEQYKDTITELNRQLEEGVKVK